MQLGLFELADWAPPQDYPRLHGPIAVDLETKDKTFSTHGPGYCFNGPGYDIVGVSVAGPDWQRYYPIAHEGGGNLPRKHVLGWLKDELVTNPDKSLELRCFNRLHDEGWLMKEGIKPTCRMVDSLTAAPLIDENRFSYQLDALARDYLDAKKLNKGLGGLEEATKFFRVDGWQSKSHGKSNLYQLPAAAVGPYAQRDARLHYDLWEAFVPLMDKDDLWEVYKLESDLVEVLLEMRFKGVRIDVDRAVRAGKMFKEKEAACVKKIHYITGKRCDIWSADSVAGILEHDGIACPKTAKTDKDSVQAKFLEGAANKGSRIAGLLLNARRYNRGEGQFIQSSILSHVVNGRIHGTFSPLRSEEGGAVTGRFSSSNPNLQNLSARKDEDKVASNAFVAIQDEIAVEVRGSFLPEEGEEWAAADYSAQEPRLCVHFAFITKCRGADRAAAAYRENPKMDFHAFGAKVTGLPRKSAKNITLGRMYEMGGAKLCHQLGLPTKWVESRRKPGTMVEIAGDEGQDILNRYDSDMPFVKLLSKLAMERAEVKHAIRTLLGRKRHFTSDSQKRGALIYKALNCLIQGSAADMIKQAMVQLWKVLKIVPLVTVHDEIGFSTPSREHARSAKVVMLNSVKLSVPNEADVELGPNWGAAKESLDAAA